MTASEKTGSVHLAAPGGQVASPASEETPCPVACAAPTEQEPPLRDLDEDGYPTEELLERVKTWPYDKGYAGLMELVRANWQWENYFQQDGNKYALSTGGWSGNEDLIGALQENTLFWVCCWESSRRGGHYEFEVAE
jgi:hypothetical protein